MKICYLNHDLRSDTGAGRFCLSLVDAMKFVAPHDSYRVFTQDGILPKKFSQLIFSLPLLRRSLAECDVIHALDGWPYGAIAALASLGLKKKMAITAIGTGAVQPLHHFFKKPILKWAYGRADAVTAVSSNTKKEILKIIPDLEIEVINHGVDYRKFESMLGISGIPGIPEIQKLKPYILSVGALKKRKGYKYSIAAFAEITPRFPDLRYVIVGDGPERKNLELTTNNLQLGNRVIFLNNLLEEELIVLYKNAELFILLPQDVSKDIEGFGLVFLEAAAAGLPVVATRGTSAEDVVSDEKSGLLVPQGDARGAAEAVAKILERKKLRENFSRNAAVFAQGMSWEKAARQYAAIYRPSGP